MPEAKKGTKTMEGTLEDHHYPAPVDNNACGPTDSSEGTANSMPPAANNPMPGADGSLSTTKISKIVGNTVSE